MPRPPSFPGPDRCPKARDDVEFRRLGEEWVLYDPVDGRFHLQDVTGALVWSYCTGDMDVEAMEKEIRRAFGAALAPGSDPGVRRALRYFDEAGLLG